MAAADGLERMKALLAELGNPEQGLKAIHIAGTNGKGSTAVMIASVLESAGYKVGLFTSPHLETECERIQIWDGRHRMISADHLEELRQGIFAAKAGKSGLHVFEVYTAAAYCWFQEENVDYAVLECGLGGRLDSTNTIEKPLVSVITHISLDHTAELGRTIIKIANEKAGIIKPNVPVVSQSPEMMVSNVLRRRAEEKGCSFVDVSELFGKYRSYKLAMAGEHQIRNAATAAEAVKAAGIEVSEEALRTGLEKAVIPGRFEVLGESPYFIVDGSHNPDATEELCNTFADFARKNKIKRALVIFGCMKDKNYGRMIQLLTGSLKGCNYAAVSAESERSEDPERIGEAFVSAGKKCICYDSVREAFDDAIASNYECVLITGSIYLAGAMRTYYLGQNCVECM
ncbi:MAG: bifunctional folylpolyglutamate synthase/dihydrofolate synthase [Mogibacterium sp.]|nr:bifunctional folylpolyglutamate synthase/dihydrofolate synthase [Mogibacterium sp.]